MDLQKKVGPLPVWGWGAAIMLGALIYYLRNKDGSAGVQASSLSTTPILDPTQGAFDMPSGISAGGTGASTTGAIPLDSLTWADVPSIWSMMPQAAAPGESVAPSTGVQEVTDVVGIIQSLREGGLIAPLAASTGAATSKAQVHTKPAPVVKRVNTSKRNPRKGQVYRVVTNPAGKPKGVYHVYGPTKASKKKRYVRVKK